MRNPQIQTKRTKETNLYTSTKKKTKGYPKNPLHPYIFLLP